MRIARIFNTYGPRMHPNDGRVVSNFIVQALSGRPLTIYGRGTQTRSFCYVDDLIDGLIRLMRRDDDRGEPVNLGNPHECTMRHIAERVLALTGSTSTIEFFDLPVDDPLQRCPDISLARRLLDWQPAVALDDGLKRTIDDFSTRVAVAPRRDRVTA